MTVPPNKEDEKVGFVDRAFRDQHGRVVLWQSPNIALWTWIVARVLVWPLHGKPETVAKFVAFVALTIWAVMEVFSGVNYFRRALGFVVLAGMISSLVQAVM